MLWHTDQSFTNVLPTFRDKICQIMISCAIAADYNEGTELDFGWGFYMTPKRKQAEYFIRKVLKYDNSETPVLLHLNVCLQNYIDEGYGYRVFPHHDREWAEFVFNCRLNPLKKHNNYDFVLGATSDSSPVNLMTRYRIGMISKQDVINSLMKHGASTDQVVIHSQSICDRITATEVLDAGTGRRLEQYE